MMKTGILLSLLLLTIVLGCGEKAVEPTTAIQGAVVAPLEKVKAAPSPAASTVVKILGKDGFSPQNSEIKAHTKVIFRNLDPKQKAAVLTFQKGTSPKFVTSEVIEAGKSWEYAFDEPEEYSFWTVGYGVKGKITVK